MNIRSGLPAGGKSVFDARPIELAGFSLRARSVVVEGKPSRAAWTRAMSFAHEVHEAAPYWIADLMAHAESREEWREAMDQMIADTGLTMKRIQNLAALRKVEEHERQIAPTPSHAEEVAPLPRPEQTKWLTKAKDEGWTRREMRSHIRAEQRVKIIDGQAPLVGMFRVVYAAPPWESMTIEALAALPIMAHTMASAVLFLWVSSARLLRNPGPRDVIEAWGFRHTGTFVWDRVTGTPGRFAHARHDLLLVCERGECPPEVILTPQPDSVQAYRWDIGQAGRPMEFRRLIEKMYPTGPRVELFASDRFGGWTALGNDPQAWAEEAS